MRGVHVWRSCVAFVRGIRSWHSCAALMRACVALMRGTHARHRLLIPPPPHSFPPVPVVQVETFEIGERAWMQNPFFRDGTKLRTGPNQEDPFLDQ